MNTFIFVIEMTTLPSIELKYSKTTEQNNKNTNTNTNTINNNIIIQPSESSESKLVESSSSVALRSETPLNVKQFKETLMTILISYFKNNIILLNNLVELSEKIITKIDDLKLLISLLLDIKIEDIYIELEEVEIKSCCGNICKRFPRYRKINDIIINKKQSFKINYNQYYIQLGTQYNISLDYCLL
jgi:hypothetical protein